MDEKRSVHLARLSMGVYLFVFLFFHPIMNYDFRFLFPILPMSLVLAGTGIMILLDRFKTMSGSIKWLQSYEFWIPFFIVLVFILQNLPRTDSVITSKVEYARSMINIHYKIGHLLKMGKEITPSQTLVVTDAGAIPYFSEWRTIDAVGLNDSQIALRKVENVSYILSQNPDVVVLTSTSPREFLNDTSYIKQLYEGAIQRGMKVVSTKVFYPKSGESIWVLARDGISANLLIEGINK